VKELLDVQKSINDNINAQLDMMNSNLNLCPHDRLDEDGICRRCGKDCRSGS